MKTKQSVVRAAWRVLSASLTFTACSGSVEDDRVVFDWEFGKGDCGIQNAACTELVDVTIKERANGTATGSDDTCTIVWGTGATKFQLVFVDVPTCKRIMAPLQNPNVYKTLRESAGCTGSPPEYLRVIYTNGGRERFQLAGCNGEPYETMRRVRTEAWKEAQKHPPL